MPLTRTVLGLLAQHLAGDADDPWSAADFSGPSGLSITVDGTTGRIKFQGQSGDGNRYAIYDPLASRSKVFMQMRATVAANAQGTPVKLCAHIQDVVADAHDIGAQMFASIGRWDGTSLDEISGINEQEDGSSAGGTSTVVPNKSAGTLYRFNVFADGLFSEMYDFDANIVGSNDNQDAYSDGQVGLGTLGDWIVEYEEWFVMLDKDLVVSGLPTGATVEVQDSGGVVLATAAEGGGVATVDMHAERLTFPDPAQVVVKDSGGAILETIAPSEGVWGGDTYELNDPPDKPSISVPDVTLDTADLAGSTYSDPDGDPHAASQWQVDEDGGDFSVPVYDSGETAVDLENHTATGLTGNTAYIARVRYKDDVGNWSPWSDSAAFTTSTSQPPDRPVLTLGEITESTVKLFGSEYSDPEDDAHVGSRWQVDEAGGGYSPPVYDSGNVTDLRSHTVPDLEAGKPYRARVAYQDAEGVWSDWSLSVDFTTEGRTPREIAELRLGPTEGDHRSFQEVEDRINEIIREMNERVIPDSPEVETVTEETVTTVVEQATKNEVELFLADGTRRDFTFGSLFPASREDGASVAFPLIDSKLALWDEDDVRKDIDV